MGPDRKLSLSLFVLAYRSGNASNDWRQIRSPVSPLGFSWLSVFSRTGPARHLPTLIFSSPCSAPHHRCRSLNPISRILNVFDVNWDVRFKYSNSMQRKKGEHCHIYVFLLIFYLDVRRNYLISLISDFLQCQLGDPLPGSSASIGAETLLHTFRTWGIYSEASLENFHVFGME